ncbi:hypothetical protein BDZ90DRAFT_257605 [Jaminaea rosea]|uniref:Uncharacterized protein n=1 Tax=Jaminaea rosea TaxID=1569628 RepID=A0A316UZ21_9BASI|nr:hypothetical protein BDZ90DRAFT_257605 [Jaminaea rosea]PWN30526.1 hypothetical protein BDZ90DRAFT_257605 [Jaminaea rosea]
MPPLADIAQRATVTGLAGLGIWGLWLTGAVWKSRRGEGAFPNEPPSSLPPQGSQGGADHPMHHDGKKHVV